MLKIGKDNEIVLTQGNSAEIDITPLDADGKIVVPSEGDKVIFVVKSHRKEVFRKELTLNDWDNEQNALILILQPEDTINLPAIGYEYDCLYVFADGSKYTFIDKTPFVLVQAISKVGEANEQA